MDLQLRSSPSASLTLPDSRTALPAAAYLSRLGSETSRRGMASALNSVAEVVCGTRDWRVLDWRKTLNAAVIDAALSKLSGSPATINKTLSALKGVARAAYRLDWIDGEQYAKIKDISGVSGSRQVRGRHIVRSEVVQLLDACRGDGSPAGLRDAALVATAVITGARRAELAALLVESLRDDEEVSITHARIIGKGNRERTLYVHGRAKDALDHWLDVRGRCDGPVFCRIDKGRTVHPQNGISTTGLAKILSKRVAQADLSDISWHDFRRMAAGNLLDEGADIATVASILGHASVTTTMRYDRRGERARVKAALMLSVP